MSAKFSKLIKIATLSFLVAGIISPPALASDQGKFKLPVKEISESLTVPHHSADVLGSKISYLEQGKSEPVLFIHGNPTSAYLWRNVIPYVADGHRAIAIDLIGMGRSAKPDIEYSFSDHYRYLEAFIETLDLGEITIVAHDWGQGTG